MTLFRCIPGRRLFRSGRNKISGRFHRPMVSQVLRSILHLIMPYTCVNVRSSVIFNKGRLLVFLLLPGEKSQFSLPYYVRGRAKFSLIWLKLKPAKSRKKIEGSTRTQRLIFISLSRDSLLA